MKSESGEEGREYDSRKLVVAAVLLGFLLILVGSLIVLWSEWEDTEATKTLYKTSMTLNILGGMISSGALIEGGIINKSINKFVRLGMLVAAALIIVEVINWVSLGYIQLQMLT